MSLSEHTTTQLIERYSALKAGNKHLRLRDAATQLGVSELELILSDLDPASFRLRDDPRQILKGMPSVGSVMCLTRNDAAVHERHGCFEDVRVDGPVGLVLGADIDLRLFFRQWSSAYYLRQTLASGIRESIQFFDISGCAILKIYATDQTDLEAFRTLAEKHRHTAGNLFPSITAFPPTPAAANIFSVDELRKAWSKLRDTHDFHGLLHQFNADRISALTAVGAPYARAISLTAISVLLEQACKRQLPIMVFVNNRCCIQIHTGNVEQYKRLENWLNILDPDFNLHLDSCQFSSAWLVRKPSDDGIVTSIEVFDQNRELCVQFFGARKPGIAERRDWVALAESMPTLEGDTCH
ncbi:hemin-degrading factor [Litorivivens sp.]|uniref:hemin-degrading factor n=1 Tax=Litorivivens sp. TaxID=2020868 RepID=UPI00356754A9